MARDALRKTVGVPLVILHYASSHDAFGILARLILVLLIPYTLSDYQGDALISLKKSLNATGHQLIDWNSDQVNPCTWTDVICDSNSGVTTSVTLSSMGLSGVISPHVGVLKNLLTLNLQGNAITGEIPEALGNLSSLTTLDLEYNKITGEIPSSLGQLTKLQFLVLSHNSLNGSIPEALSTIRNLIDLLTGSVPESLFKIPKYNFSGNDLDCGRGFAHPCETSPNPDARRSIVPLIAGLVGGLAALLLLTRLLLFFAVGRPKGGEVYVDVAGEVDRRIPFGQLRRFAWRELQLATNGFDERNVLGRGGFGKVYRGVLSDGTEVAVKRLADSESPGGDAAFRREVEMISVAVHRNLLRLIGFCATSSERLLVYPFMANLSVAHRLRDLKPGDPVLSWESRRRAALGTARGLEYLHEHCDPRIIHRDVKAANVLLDDSLEAVVGDFGLAQLVDVRRADVTTQVRGTMGHIAPEYLSTGKSSERTDVFGYGVTLLELVTGQRAVDFSRLDDEDDVLLLDHVKKLEREGRLDSIVDPNLRGRYDASEVQMITRVALLCTQPSPDDRPAMSEVVRMLEGEGLDERWEEWKNVEVTRREEYQRLQRRLDWPGVAPDDSVCNIDAIELSAGR